MLLVVSVTDCMLPFPSSTPPFFRLFLHYSQTDKDILEMIHTSNSAPIEPEEPEELWSQIPSSSVEDEETTNINGASISSPSTEAQVEDKDSISETGHVPVGISFMAASELEGDDVVEDDVKLGFPSEVEAAPPIEASTVEQPSKETEPEGGAVDGSTVALESEVEKGEQGGKGIVVGEAPSEAKENGQKKEDGSAAVELESTEPEVTTKIVEVSKISLGLCFRVTSSELSPPPPSSFLLSVRRPKQLSLLPTYLPFLVLLHPITTGRTMMMVIPWEIHLSLNQLFLQVLKQPLQLL